MRPISSRAATGLTPWLCPALCLLALAVSNLVLSAQLKIEPLGPSSRRTGLVISEIMHLARPGPDGERLEFLELYNSNPFFEEISGFKLSGAITYTFPQNTFIPAFGFLLVARDPNDFQEVYHRSALGPYSGGLANFEELFLLNREGAVLLRMGAPLTFNANPVLAGAEFTGHSLVLARPSCGEASPLAWGLGDVMGGTPGFAETYGPEPLRAVVINEFMAAGNPALNFVELYNHSNLSVDLSGAFLSTSSGNLTNQFRIPVGTILPPRGFVSFAPTNFNPGLTVFGGSIFLVNSNGTRVIDAIRFAGQADAVSTGRFPDGAHGYQPLASPTPGARNSRPRLDDIVINELMYAPLTGGADEYVELYNRGSNAVPLEGWRLTDGVQFTFPAKAVIPARGYLVVANDLTNLASHYPGRLNATNAYGNLGGGLNNSLDRVALQWPDIRTITNVFNQVVQTTNYVTADEVTYLSGGRWGKLPRENGSSLELIDARGNHRLADNWAASDESAKGGWTTIETTGVLETGQTYSNEPIDALHILLLNEGECLLDDVEVIPQGGANLIPNGTFETGTAGWVMQGDHVRSTWETSEGHNSNRSLHIRAGSRGDTGANRIRVQLSAPLSPGQTVTLRAKARWLNGWPEILLRVRGNFLEATGALHVPKTLGTPGERNSRAVSNAAPAIYDVSHHPILPAAGEAAVVSARLDDPDGIAAAVLNYRIDPATNYAAVPMMDDGTGGDAVADDGIFSATIPGQPAGTLVAFFLTATDSNAAPASNQFPTDVPARECLVRFGDPVSTNGFGTYRLWMTQKTLDAWSTREVLSNDRLDGTFVYGNVRVVYNGEWRYAGSPYHQDFDSPIGKPCHYSFYLPGDQPVLGTANFNKMHAPGNAPFDDPTIQTEQTAYWIARQIGLPWNHKRYINFFVNGVRRGTLMEDTQVPNGDELQELYQGDNDGDLFKLQPWNEFDNTTSGAMNFTNVSWCTLNDQRRSDGTKNRARFRWNFLVRSAEHTANNYQPVFDLVDAVNTPTNGAFQFNVEQLVDVEQWMRTFAVQRAVGNWDSFGSIQGQNTYAYKLPTNVWQLLIWDFEVVLGNSFSDGPTGDAMFRPNPADLGLQRLYSFPPFRRAYWRALKEIAEGPMVSTRVNPVVDAKYAAFTNNGLAVTSSVVIKDWIAARRSYLLSNLAPLATPFAVSGPLSFSTNENFVTFRGTAPVELKTIRVNNVIYPVTWLSDTQWTLNLALKGATNVLTFQGYDRLGKVLPGFVQIVTAEYTGPVVAPKDTVVISEIMFASEAGAFVELVNTATNFAFDLSNWRLEGSALGSPDAELFFRFPAGTVLAGGQSIVIVANRKSFADAYGIAVPIAGVFGGSLGSNGGLVSLSMPTTTNGLTLIDKVRYETELPWPAAATNRSLQLRDARQDNVRVSNWSALPPTPAAANAGQTNLTPYPTLWLNEVQVHNATGIQDSAGDRDPWIELYNAGTNSISLDGCILADGYGNPLEWNFPAGRLIAPGQFLVVWTDGEPAETTAAELHTSFRPGTNSGAIVLARTVNGQPQILDYLNYPLLAPDSSYGDFPDGVPFARQLQESPTPGSNNQARVRVSVNEWMASNDRFMWDPVDNQFEDWFELYNAGDAEVDLSGYRLGDPSGTPPFWRIPDGTFIGPRSFLLVWADDEPSQNGSGLPALHVPFKLAKETDLILLLKPDGGILDSRAFGTQLDDVSEGRFPDGGEAIVAFKQTPTPGTKNRADRFTLILTNSQVVGVGQEVRFNASVAGAPIPPYVVTFSLGSGAPAGARIDVSTGVFTWTPDGNQSPSTNHVVVRASNNGPPFFDLSGSVTIAVPAGPQYVSSTRQPNGELVLAWSVIPGRTHRLQYTDDLTAGQWFDFGDSVNAVSSLLTFTVQTTSPEQRFFRLVQLD